MQAPGWTRGLVLGAVGALGGAALIGGIGSLLGGVALARRAVTPAAVPESPVTVTHVVDRPDGGVLVRLRGVDADLPGRYSFIFDGGRGHARLGEVVEASGDEVLRKLVSVDRGSLAPETRGRVTGWWYTDPEQLGYRVERTAYATELGDAEAWIIRPRIPRKRRWAVHVHGRGALPEETLRGVRSLARCGITSLVISYRNDPGAPPGLRGRYGVGFSESRDVDAAIAAARRLGAERVTLFGWSMGGTACLVAATRGEYRHLVDGLILDSPAVDWNALLRYHAAAQSAPAAIAGLGIELLARGVVAGGEAGGIPIDDLHPETFARALAVPVLIHASPDDTFVPPAGAERLAQLRPDLVQLRLQPGAEHVKLWNVDQRGWEAVTRAFARALPRPPWRG
ncbi:alpha/beta hydrolase family protein [Leucobacter chromiiresistens]